MYPLWHPLTSAQALPPPCVKKAFGSQLELSDGTQLIDAIGSWWTSVFGHSYPPLVQALKKQAEELDHVLFGSVTHEPAQKVARLLVELLGPGKVVFSDNGSCAVEIGMKLACQLASLRGEKGRTLFASFQGGYHGDTIGVMGLQGHSVFTEPYLTLLREGILFPFVDTWEGDTTVQEREEEALAKIDELLRKKGKEIIAFVFEPLLQGSSGMRMCRSQYLQRVAALMKEHGVLLIADEVMTGLGRTGDFFASTKAHVEWDILALSKGLAGGMLPLAVTFVRERLFQEFFQHDAMLFHGHTFTANPIACAVAAKTLELLHHNRALFEQFEKRYEPFQKELEGSFLKIRTLGCLWAGELSYSFAYGSPKSLELRQHFLDRGVLARPLGSVLYFFPAYTISDEELSLCFEAVRKLIPKVSSM